MGTIKGIYEGLFSKGSYRVYRSLVGVSQLCRKSPNIYLDRDTVGSLGVVPKVLPVTTARTLTRTFRHAVSLDERRSRFEMTLWELPSKTESHLDNLSAECIETDVEEVWFTVRCMLISRSSPSF